MVFVAVKAGAAGVVPQVIDQLIPHPGGLQRPARRIGTAVLQTAISASVSQAE